MYWDDPIDSNSDGTPDFRDGTRSPGAYQNWRQANFARNWIYESLASWLADPDDDGFVNGLEYALLGAANSSDASLFSPDPSAPAIHFRRNPLATDTTITVWTSADLTTWHPAARSVEGAAFTPLLPDWYADESSVDGQVKVGRPPLLSNEGIFIRVSVAIEHQGMRHSTR
jgi:hypothetical protein